MGKKRFISEDRIFELERENRELKEQIEALIKRLKKVDKRFKKEQDNANKPEEKQPEETTKNTKRKCEVCEKGKIIEVEIVGRFFERCNTCNYKSKRIK